MKRLYLSFSHPNTVTLLRCISILMIVSVHSPVSWEFIQSGGQVIIDAMSHTAIRLFIFLSGYVLANGYVSGKYSLTVKGVLIFWGRRFKRIAPWYYVVVFYLFLLTPVTNPLRQYDLLRLLTFTATPPITLISSGYLWFISTLMQLYLLAPVGFLLLKILLRSPSFIKQLVLFLLLIVGSVYRYFIITPDLHQFPYSSWYMNIDNFLFGMVVALVIRKYQSKNMRAIIRNAINICILFFLGYAMYAGSMYVFGLQNPVMIGYFCLLLMPVLSVLGGVLLLFVNKQSDSVQKNGIGIIAILVFPYMVIGVYSYQIYLLHQPLLSLFGLPCGPPCTVMTFGYSVGRIVGFALLIIGCYEVVRLLVPIILSVLHLKRKRHQIDSSCQT